MYFTARKVIPAWLCIVSTSLWLRDAALDALDEKKRGRKQNGKGQKTWDVFFDGQQPGDNDRKLK